MLSPGGNVDSVAEFAFALILAVSRRVRADGELRKGMSHEMKTYNTLMGVQLG